MKRTVTLVLTLALAGAAFASVASAQSYPGYYPTAPGTVAPGQYPGGGFRRYSQPVRMMGRVANVIGQDGMIRGIQLEDGTYVMLRSPLYGFAARALRRGMPVRVRGFVSADRPNLVRRATITFRRQRSWGGGWDRGGGGWDRDGRDRDGRFDRPEVAPEPITTPIDPRPFPRRRFR